VRFVIDRLALPQASDCSVCHHPPVYYVVAAGVYRGCETVGASPERGLQLLSLFMMGVFTFVSALTVASLLPRSYQQRLAIALVVFCCPPDELGAHQQ
jgi:hypothetical protein